MQETSDSLRYARQEGVLTQASADTGLAVSPHAPLARGSELNQGHTMRPCLKTLKGNKTVSQKREGGKERRKRRKEEGREEKKDLG